MIKLNMFKKALVCHSLFDLMLFLVLGLAASYGSISAHAAAVVKSAQVIASDGFCPSRCDFNGVPFKLSASQLNGFLHQAKVNGFSCKVSGIEILCNHARSGKPANAVEAARLAGLVRQSAKATQAK